MDHANAVSRAGGREAFSVAGAALGPAAGKKVAEQSPESMQEELDFEEGSGDGKTLQGSGPDAVLAGGGESTKLPANTADLMLWKNKVDILNTKTMGLVATDEETGEIDSVLAEYSNDKHTTKAAAVKKSLEDLVSSVRKCKVEESERVNSTIESTLADAHTCIQNPRFAEKCAHHTFKSKTIRKWQI